MEVVRSTWLTQRPHRRAWFIAAWSVFLLFMGSILYWKDFAGAATWMSASGESVFSQGHFVRLWLALFAHADMGHLLSNSFLFFTLGYFLSGYFGFWVFPLAAFFCGGVVNAIVLLSYPSQISLVGVSGVVYWMGGVWLLLYFLIDVQRTRLQRALRSVGVALGIFMPSTAFDPQISYRAHFVGFVVGILFAILYYQFQRRHFLDARVIEEIPEESEEVLAVGEPKEIDRL